MPALSSTSLLNTFVARNATATATATNATSNALQVVCAWPLSGQYGPGPRALYYVLIAACVFAPKEEWLRNALLIPVIPALHGIALAALHVNGAVDMDIYGALQLCLIGVLAVPVRSKLSKENINDPGRNLIFLWIILILAGLLSLTVEFLRLNTSDCTHDDSGNPISLDAGEFPYGTTCGLACSIDQGPFSSIRSGSANNIYVIPAPDKLNFGMATLFAATCCIPAVLSLITMWYKILKSNWKKRFGNIDEDKRIDHMRWANDLIKKFLSAVVGSVFGVAALAIVIIGEMNFFSSQVYYQNEPMTAIGQWAPISGAILAAIMVLYLFLAETEGSSPNASMHHCNCATHEGSTGLSGVSSHPFATPGATSIRRSSSNSIRENSTETAPTTSQTSQEQGHNIKRASSRLRVAKVLIAASDWLSTPAQDQFDLSWFKHGKAHDYPEFPGELLRNPNLAQTREHYNQSWDADGNATPVLHGSRSRAGSFTSAFSSGIGVEDSSAIPTVASFLSPLAPPPIPQRPHAATLLAEHQPFKLHTFPSSTSTSATGGRPRQRDLLEVPSPVHHSHMRNNSSASAVNSIIDVPDSQSSSAYIISSDPSMSTSTHTLIPNPPASSLLSEPLLTPSTPASPPLS